MARHDDLDVAVDVTARLLSGWTPLASGNWRRYVKVPHPGPTGVDHVDQEEVEPIDPLEAVLLALARARLKRQP